MSRPGHDRADRAAAALPGPAVEPQPGRRTDHRRGRGGRPYRLARLAARARVPGPTQGDVRSGTVSTPSVEGYATAAMASLPSLCAALDLWPLDEVSPEQLPRRGRVADRAGRDRGRRRGRHRGDRHRCRRARARPPRRWALLRHRRRQQIPTPATVDPEGEPDAEPDAVARVIRRSSGLRQPRSRTPGVMWRKISDWASVSAWGRSRDPPLPLLATRQ